MQDIRFQMNEIQNRNGWSAAPGERFFKCVEQVLN